MFSLGKSKHMRCVDVCKYLEGIVIYNNLDFEVFLGLEGERTVPILLHSPCSFFLVVGDDFVLAFSKVEPGIEHERHLIWLGLGTALQVNGEPSVDNNTIGDKVIVAIFAL